MAREKFTILVVDDDPNDVHLLKRAFQVNGIANPVQVVTDGAEAIHYLGEAARFQNRVAFPYPGLIVLDLKMPRKTGLEVLIWLKDHPDCYVIPVIVFTASSQLADVKLSYGHGANSYIVKPRSFDELRAAVRTIFDYWNLCEKLPPEKLENLDPLGAVPPRPKTENHRN